MGLLAIPIIVLYMLKLQRQKIGVSSILLWQMVLQDRQANRPWQKLKRNLLMIIQLVILAMLVLALIQPTVPGKTISNNQVIVILDATASMQASDIPPSRFEAAKKEIKTIIDDLPNSSEMTIILAGPKPIVLLAHSQNKTEMREVVVAATVSYGEANWKAVIALANASITVPDHLVVFLSDGNIPEKDISLYTDRFQYIQIGSGGENLGISAFSVTPAKSGSEMFIKVRNYGNATKSGLLSIFQGEELLLAKRIEIAPNQYHTEVVTELPASIQTYTARLTSDTGEGYLDDYSLDDQAFVAYHPPESKRILLVSEGNFFLEQFLSVLPRTEAFKSLPGGDDQETPFPNEGFSIYIYDGSFPDKLPNGNLLLINPLDNQIFSVAPATGEYGQVEVVDHSLTQYVEWEGVQILQTKVVESPVWAETLVNSEAGPLVFVGEFQSRRFAVVSFDLLDSDLPLHVAFPILLSQLLDYLNPPVMYDAPNGYRVEDVVQLKPRTSVETLHVLLPSGIEQDLVVDENGATFLDTQQPGIYTITTLPGEFTEQFVVNVFSDIEAGIIPNQGFSIARQTSNDPQETPQQMGLKGVWQIPLTFAIFILLGEWWLYYRRPLPASVIKNIAMFRQRNTR